MGREVPQKQNSAYKKLVSDYKENGNSFSVLNIKGMVIGRGSMMEK